MLFLDNKWLTPNFISFVVIYFSLCLYCDMTATRDGVEFTEQCGPHVIFHVTCVRNIDLLISRPVTICLCSSASLSLSRSQGAFWGLAIGLLVGCIRMLLDFIYPAPLCYEEDDRPAVLKYVHYLYFSVLLSFITLAVLVVVSLATEEPKPEQVRLLICSVI